MGRFKIFSYVFLVAFLSASGVLAASELELINENPNPFFIVSVITTPVRFLGKASSETMLRIGLKDSSPATGVCTYYQQSFKFDPIKKSIDVTVVKDFCPNDIFGQSQGEVDWVVPKSLISSTAKMCLFINNFKVRGVVFDHESKVFVLSDKCE